MSVFVLAALARARARARMVQTPTDKIVAHPFILLFPFRSNPVSSFFQRHPSFGLLFLFALFLRFSVYLGYTLFRGVLNSCSRAEDRRARNLLQALFIKPGNYAASVGRNRYFSITTPSKKSSGPRVSRLPRPRGFTRRIDGGGQPGTK